MHKDFQLGHLWIFGETFYFNVISNLREKPGIPKQGIVHC